MNNNPVHNTHWCGEVYRSEAPRLLLYGRALGLTFSEAEDVLQETFMALLHLVSRPAEPGFYCLRAFRNRALNFRRNFWRRIKRELESKAWFEPGIPPGHSEHRAMQALARLPVDQREVIVLKIWHEHTFETIGALLEISPNTAAGRYRYGLEKIRKQLTTAYERNQSIGETTSWLGSTGSIA